MDSTFGHETSLLTTATESAWDHFALTSAHVSEHRSKKTWWGSAASYHVGNYKDFEVESGTAWIQHRVKGFAMSQVEKGSWSH